MGVTETFDYVVVGAGSAGCVLARRLTEDPGTTALLLEAGGPDDADEIRIPAAFASLFKTRWDWNYETVPQERLGGARAYWPRMKALGGCSSMNAMIYIRGNRADYDGWRDEHGLAGWGYDDVLPYFVRAEGNTALTGPYHGTDGPLHVEDRRSTHELTDAFVDAAVASGLKPTDDFNGATQEGAGRYQVTCRRGRRWSTADGYLRPALDRPNLTLRTHAAVRAVRIEGGRAVGLTYQHNGVDVGVEAGQVILSGGAIASPQILMLAGIGPADHLRDVGVDVVADLPGVGRNLHDHPAVPLIWSTRGTTDLAAMATPARLVQWQATGGGPLTSNVGEGGAFLATRGGLDGPDLQIHVAPTGFYDNGLREPVGPMFTMAATLVAVASRGSLRLRSADPRWKPAIDPRYYAEAADLDAMRHGLRRLDEIATHQPLAGFLGRRFIPDGSVSDAVLTDDVIDGVIRTWTQTLYHPVGTCAMGTGADAVVDGELRVRGVAGLRVVDASVMPEIPRGNTNAPTVMIAEMAADLMRGRDPLGPALR